MNRRTAYVLGGATLVAAALVLSGVRVLMVLGGLPIALVLPGLALTALLFPRPGRLVTIERVLLVPALSLGTLILGGLLAWVVRAPLHRVTWLAIGAGVTLAASAAAALRTAGVLKTAGALETPSVAAGRSAAGASPVREEESRPALTLPPALDRDGAYEPEPMDRRRRLLRQAVPAALAVVLLAGAAWLSLATSISSHRVTVTTLSVVPPGPADATGDRGIQVDATGLSAGSTYALQVTSTSENTRTTLTADENGRWTSTLHLPADERLTLALYRAGETTALRTVIVASAATG